MELDKNDEIPTLKKETVIKTILITLVGFIIIYTSYIFANQPGCPICKNTNDVIFTFKIYKNGVPKEVSLTRILQFGYCVHKDTFGNPVPASHFCWYCAKHKKRILKPLHWRQK